MEPRVAVRGLIKFEEVEIQDLDCVTTEHEVESQIRDALDLAANDQTVKTRSMRKSFMETQRATVKLRSTDAYKLIERCRIKIGWVYARVRLKIRAVKCFRCLGYGHIRHSCTGPDRSASCHLCNKEEHRA